MTVKPQKPTLPTDIATMSFEKALEELEGVVSVLERGDIALEESITKAERGEYLKQRCEALLKEAEMRIAKITLGSDGVPNGVTALEPSRTP